MLTDIEQQLIACIRESSEWNKTDDQIVALVSDDDFDRDAGRVHNWRNHVPYEIREHNLWYGLSLETRLAIYLGAECAAGREEWE